MKMQDICKLTIAKILGAIIMKCHCRLTYPNLIFFPKFVLLDSDRFWFRMTILVFLFSETIREVRFFYRLFQSNLGNALLWLYNGKYCILP